MANGTLYIAALLPVVFALSHSHIRERSVDPDDIGAARLMLLVAKAAARVETGKEIVRYRINDDETVLAEEDAVQKLSALPKPLDCSAKWNAPMLRLQCAAVDQPKLPGGLSGSDIADDMSYRLAAMADMLGEDVPGGKHSSILVRGPGIDVVLSKKAIRLWCLLYTINASYSFSAVSPDAEQMSRGISKVINVSMPRPMSHLPPGLTLPE